MQIKHVNPVQGLLMIVACKHVKSFLDKQKQIYYLCHCDEVNIVAIEHLVDPLNQRVQILGVQLIMTDVNKLRNFINEHLP